MNEKTIWQYVITPTFVGRFHPFAFEVCHLESGDWEPCDDIAIRKIAQEDGKIVSEEHALQAYEQLKIDLKEFNR